MATALLLIACARLGGIAATPTLATYSVSSTTRSFSYSLPDGSPRTIVADIWYPTTSERSWPLVVFSHGSGGKPGDDAKFLDYVASQGFVVAAPRHEDCGASCGASAYSAELVRRPLDVQTVLDGMLGLDGTNDSIFGNHLIDATRAGVAGQSLGGWTALQAVQTDARYRAALVMNAATYQLSPVDPTRITQPLLMMAGELDALVPFAQTEDFYSRLPASQDRYLLIVPHAGHEFVDECFDSALTVGGCAGAIPQDQLLGIEQLVGTAFLNLYVAGVNSGSLSGAETADYRLVAAHSGSSAVPLPTAAPLRATPTPAASPGAALFSDLARLPATSSDPSRYSVAYSDGTYDITVKRPFDQGEALIPGTYADTTLRVDATLVHPQDDQYLQLACRWDGAGSQYRMGVRPETGEVWVNRWLPVSGNRPYTTLYDTVSTAVHPGAEVNHLELACKGTTIKVSINGTMVASISDNTLQAGQLWIAAGETRGGAHPDVATEAHFQNVSVVQD